MKQAELTKLAPHDCKMNIKHYHPITNENFDVSEIVMTLKGKAKQHLFLRKTQFKQNYAIFKCELLRLIHQTLLSITIP